MKGKPVDELDDDVALERKYPPELIVKNKYFFHYEDDLFGWYFDAELCYKASLSDYQRLVIFNDVSVVTVFAASISVMHLHLMMELDQEHS